MLALARPLRSWNGGVSTCCRRSPLVRSLSSLNEVARSTDSRSETFPSVGELWGSLRRALGLASLRSLEATLPPESRPISTASLHPLAHSAPPVRTRAAWEPVVYAVGTFLVLVLGGLTVQRARNGSEHRPRDGAATAPAIACEHGMIAAGAASVRLGAATDPDEPPHDVTLSPFCIDKDAVTTSAYKACSARGDCLAASRTNEWDGIGPDDHEVLDAFCTARDPDPIWAENNCGADNHYVSLGRETYFISADGYLMPTKKDQPVPHLQGFGPSTK